MANIKTILITEDESRQGIGKQPEKQTWDMIYHAGVAYRITSASKFVHNRQREQELRVKREG